MKMEEIKVGVEYLIGHPQSRHFNLRGFVEAVDVELQGKWFGNPKKGIRFRPKFERGHVDTKLECYERLDYDANPHGSRFVTAPTTRQWNSGNYSDMKNPSKYRQDFRCPASYIWRSVADTERANTEAAAAQEQRREERALMRERKEEIQTRLADLGVGRIYCERENAIALDFATAEKFIALLKGEARE